MTGSSGNSPSPTGTVRIAPVAAIPRVLEHLGFEPVATLAEMGFDIQLFEDPENVIPYVARSQLLERCADKTGCRHFGHLVARSTSPSSFGITGFLIQQLPDVATAIRAFVRYLHLHVDGAVTYLEEEPDSAFLGYSIPHPGDGVTEQIADAGVTAAFNIMRKLCGETWHPTQVCFTHGKPENTRPFKQYFRAPLQFNAAKNGVAFSSIWLKSPLMGADPELRVLLQRQIDLLENRHSDDFTEQVSRVTHSAVLMHQANAEYVADLFAIHQRTLNRRLRNCGTCFREILDKCRFDIAQQLLGNSSLNVSDIAAILDYTDASAFARAFRRQSGKAPSAWREHYRQHNT